MQIVLFRWTDHSLALTGWGYWAVVFLVGAITEAIRPRQSK